MTYLDTSCFVKLYYPEPDSQKVIALVQGKRIAFTPLHELEFVNALQLKVFTGTANAAQVAAARSAVEADLKASVLDATAAEWRDVFPNATKLAEQYSSTIGCRSLDVLHCAMAKLLAAADFVSADVRQKKLATAMGLNLVTY